MVLPPWNNVNGRFLEYVGASIPSADGSEADFAADPVGNGW